MYRPSQVYRQILMEDTTYTPTSLLSPLPETLAADLMSEEF